MRLLIYLDGQLLDSADLSVTGSTSLRLQRIRELMQQLLDKHKRRITSSGQDPVFYLDGVPSSINGFQSLMGDGSSNPPR